MFHQYIPNPDATPALAVHLLFEEQADAYREAAGLLAGPRGRRMVDRILEALASAVEITPRNYSALQDLLDILALERVDIFDSEEAARFSEINPNDPVVEEICLLTDQLRSALQMADPDHPPALCKRGAA